MHLTELVGYTVAYDTIYGAIGYIGIDKSNGYPTFVANYELNNVFKDVSNAFNLLRTTHNEMKNYCGNELIDWKSLHVVKITNTIEAVNFDQYKIMKESILSKLSDDELEFVLSENFRNEND